MRGSPAVTVELADHAALGESDCEALHDAFLAQPFAALSSLGYVLAGLALLFAWRDLPGRQRWAARTYGGLLVLVGAGSVIYHGPQGTGAGLMHDLPIPLLLAEAVAVPVVRALQRRPAIRPEMRSRLVAVLLLSGLAAFSYWAGRTGSPVCAPDSGLQAHGLWHLLGAAALACWGTLLWPAPAREGGAWPGRWRRGSRVQRRDEVLTR